jgi:hypothetical protein
MAVAAKQLFDDLLSIEVDVVVCPCLPCVPKKAEGKEAPFFVNGLAAMYRDFLDRWHSWAASDRATEFASHAPGPCDGDVGVGLADASTDELESLAREAALAEEMARALAETGELPDPHVIPIFRRIRGTVEQLRLASGPARLRVARKSWELGTAIIVAQTVVQVDGDIVQRVDGSRESRAVGELHRDAVSGAIGQWDVLVELFVTVVVGSAGLLRSLFGGPGALRRRRSRRRQLREQSDRSGWTLLDPRVIRATIGEFIEMMRALVARGGVSIGQAGKQAIARTVIQADGDSVWLIRSDALDRRADLGAHAQAVTEWYENAKRLAATVERYASAIPTAVAGIVGGASVILAIARDSVLPLVIGLVMTVALPWCLRRLLRWYIRRKANVRFA